MPVLRQAEAAGGEDGRFPPATVGEGRLTHPEVGLEVGLRGGEWVTCGGEASGSAKGIGRGFQ